MEASKGGEKRTFGRTFYNFLSSGGLIVLIVVGFILAIVISVLVGKPVSK